MCPTSLHERIVVCVCFSLSLSIYLCACVHVCVRAKVLLSLKLPLFVLQGVARCRRVLQCDTGCCSTRRSGNSLLRIARHNFNLSPQTTEKESATGMNRGCEAPRHAGSGCSFPPPFAHAVKSKTQARLSLRQCRQFQNQWVPVA